MNIVLLLPVIALLGFASVKNATGGCETGKICVANSGGPNECLSTQASQFNVTWDEQVNVTQEMQVDASLQEEQNSTQDLIYFCAESYNEAVENCS
jgi:accessory colonization factor AcfC